MKRNIAIALAILCTLVFSIYCYSQMPPKVPPPKKASAEGKEVTVSQKTVMTDFATVFITKDNAGNPVVRGRDGTYSSIKIFKSYQEFEKYVSILPANSVPLVFDITLSPGVNYYAVATGSCRMQAGKMICQ
jgi:hypothetical protein